MDSKIFCPAPFTHFFHKGTPFGKVCCISDNRIIHRERAEQTWSNSRLNEIRQDLLANKSVTDCEPCYKTEREGGVSDRLMFMGKYGPEKKITYNLDTGNQFNKPIDLDLRLSNLCNLGCRMCGPHYSSILEKEISEIPELHRLQGEPNSANQMLTDDDINWLIRDNPELRRIKFLGGEPTIMPEVYKILDALMEEKMQPRIGITTNCTNVNKRFIEYLNYFNHININMSIDGVGNALEYIRAPVNYEKVKENSNTLCKIATTTNINFAMQALNISNLTDFMDFVVSLPGESFADVNSVIVRWPAGSSPFYLPLEYRKPLLEKALNHKEINNPRFTKRFKANLEAVYRSELVHDMQDFLFRNMLFDQKRKTHLYKVMPEYRDIAIKFAHQIGKSSQYKERIIEHYEKGV